MSKFKGFIFAATAAAAYGTNPAFAIPLYADGMNPVSVLLFRYGLCLPILLVMIAVRGQSISLKWNEIAPTAILGVLMAISSLTLFESYNYMNSGVASTLLFVYPVLVAIIMTFVYHEKFKLSTVICLLIMAWGLLLMMRSGMGVALSLWGCILVFLSALTYALYLVMTNINKTVQSIPTLRFLFWQFLFGCMVFLADIILGQPIVLPSQHWMWINLLALALLPTVVSLGLTTKAIHLIGSTPTAIFGALEPLTAVLLSVLILGQSMTLREMIGAVLIMIATTVVVAADPIDKTLLRMRRLFPKLRK